MKKLVLYALLISVTLFSQKSFGQTAVVYYWDFNAMDSAAHNPHYTAPGAGTASYNYWCSYTDFTSGSTQNIQLGDTAGDCIRFRNPSDSVVFFMPTTGCTNVTFSYTEQRTSSGAFTNMIYYTTDGVHYKPSSNADNVDSSTYTVDSTDYVTDPVLGWQVKTFSFSGDTNTNNNPNFAVAIVFVQGPDSSSGNDRFDNVTLKGDTSGLRPSTSAVQTATVNSSTYKLFPNPSYGIFNIISNYDGDKTYEVFNMFGQKVYQGAGNNKEFMVDASIFAPGIYYVNIKETALGTSATLKFAKQ